MDEIEIARALKRWARPDDAFGEELLQRCLAVLRQGDGAVLDDEDLEMLAAAGDAFPPVDPPGGTQDGLLI